MEVLYVYNAGRLEVRSGRSSSSANVKTQRDAQKGQKIYLFKKATSQPIESKSREG